MWYESSLQSSLSVALDHLDEILLHCKLLGPLASNILKHGTIGLVSSRYRSVLIIFQPLLLFRPDAVTMGEIGLDLMHILSVAVPVVKFQKEIYPTGICHSFDIAIALDKLACYRLIPGGSGCNSYLEKVALLSLLMRAFQIVPVVSGGGFLVFRDSLKIQVTTSEMLDIIGLWENCMA